MQSFPVELVTNFGFTKPCRWKQYAGTYIIQVHSSQGATFRTSNKLNLFNLLYLSVCLLRSNKNNRFSCPNHDIYVFFFLPYSISVSVIYCKILLIPKILWSTDDSHAINSMAPGRWDESVIFKIIIQNSLGIHCEFALRYMPQNLTNESLTHLPISAAYMNQWMGSALPQIVVWHIFGII